MPKQLTEKELYSKLQAFNKSTKKGEDGLLPEDVVNELNNAIKNSDGIQDAELKSFVENIKKVPKNDFSKLEKLPGGVIAILSSQAYYEAKAANALDNSERCLDPFLRHGLERAAVTTTLSDAERQNAKQINDRLAETVLSDTLAPVKGDALKVVQEKYKDKADKMLTKNRLEQLTLAKTMLLTHLGSMHIMQKDGRNVEYEGSVADAMAHGGRTAFFFGKGKSKDGDRTQELLFNNNEKATAVDSRIAATHGMDAGKAAEGAGAYKETSGVSFRNNYQMNPALGGLGQKFGNKPILNDGLNGQVFLKMQNSTAKKGGYLMVGFENEKSGTTGRTGHKHDARAKGAKFSSLMGTKGGPGASKGGRVVDLSMYKPDQLNSLLERFNDGYEKLQKEAPTNPEAEKKLNEINKSLTGKIMAPEAVLDLIENQLVSDKKLNFDFKEKVTGKNAFSQEKFKQLNDKAEAKLAKARAKHGVEQLQKRKDGEELYVPKGSGQKILNDLQAAKKAKLDFSKESSKMKKIKIQLMDMADAWSKGNLGKEEAKKALSALYDSTKDYMQDPKKNQGNKRMEAVKKVNKFVTNELKSLGVDIQPALTNAEIKKQAKQEVKQKNVAVNGMQM